MTSARIGEEWVGRIVDARFPLLQWLGGRAECGVFLTERPGGSGEKAAIKVLPAAVADAEGRTAGWDAALRLEHPHLLQVYGHGRCELDGAEFAYVVTEYAPEVLAEILRERALTPEETRAALGPLLDALEYLHGKGLVHGHVKPTNIMAQGDMLKLTADHMLRAGVASVSTDVWLLGATLVEMLTQRPPVAGANGGLVAPSGLPEPFGGIAGACLRVTPDERCGLAEIRARLNGAWPEPVVPAAAEPGRPVVGFQGVDHVEPRRPARRGKWWIAVLAAVVAVIAVGAFLLWPREVGRGEGSSVSDSTAAPVAALPAMAPGVVVRRVPPEVLQSALETIYGTVRVDVRVTAGTGGRVIDAEFAEHGPSRYFAKAAMAAAMQWVFRPAQVNGGAVRSVWLLKFEFTRDGAQVTATEVSP